MKRHHCTLAGIFFYKIGSSDSITKRVVTPVISSFSQLRGVENVLFGRSSDKRKEVVPSFPQMIA